jgi:transcription elongation factor GreA
MKTRQTYPHLKPIPFTQEGLDKTKKEFEELTKERPDAVENLRKAREMGDLKENGYYHAAKARLVGLDARLRKLNMLIKLGRVVPMSTGDWVTIGSKVTVRIGEKERVFDIVGGYESDPLEGKISHVSPIGKALMGKRKGETAIVQAPAGTITYIIVNINN